MRLYAKCYSDQGPPLIILHGLFGQQGNWATHARSLAGNFAVYAFDARNHGQSEWAGSMDYPAMAADVRTTMDVLGIERASFIGHSMGGKTAMQLALLDASRVHSLVVVDIAPVSYSSGPDKVLQALQELPLNGLESRADAGDFLAERISNKGVRDFLLTNLRRDGEGIFSWRMNLPVISDSYAALRAAPEGGQAFPGPVLFIKGAGSDYLLPEYQDRTLKLFPQAEVRVIAGAGHWVHSEKPEIFLRLVSEFLLSRHGMD